MRSIEENTKEILRRVEYELLFYRLYGLERGLSKMHRITWLIFSALVDLKKICKDKDLRRVIKLKGKFLGNILGAKWLLSKKLGSSYTPIEDLKEIVKRRKKTPC